eukprot:TRINITY_DN16426_c0_g1_i1.p2 TRINITY_DN16426_c0_g1~~TRINITY_DN16426_c0_g1_i1.p2  ORF type:complete len:102 (-),score=21.74 TRINITY_DN16426_c0_g1_i1:200-505(-)
MGTVLMIWLLIVIVKFKIDEICEDHVELRDLDTFDDEEGCDEEGYDDNVISSLEDDKDTEVPLWMQRFIQNEEANSNANTNLNQNANPNVNQNPNLNFNQS